MAQTPDSLATLDELTALNRELAALVRAGLPLEPGLRQIAADAAGPTSQIAASLERELSSGASLAEAVAAQGERFPPIYRAMVTAGARSGQLADAFENLADAAMRAAELRRVAVQAMLYPLAVAFCAWFLMVLVVLVVHPIFQSLEMHQLVPAGWMERTGLGFVVAALLPLAAAVVIFVWLRRTNRPQRRAMSGLPGGTRLERLTDEATFADLLHLLVAARVPLDQGLPLAAAGVRRPQLLAAAQELSVAAASGASLRDRPEALATLPPLVRLALLCDTSFDALVGGLQRAATTYRNRAELWLRRVSFALPIVATAGVGGTIVAGYAVVSLTPYFALLHELSRAVSTP